MLTLLDRQLIRNYLKSYLICLVSMMSLFIVVDLAFGEELEVCLGRYPLTPTPAPELVLLKPINYLSGGQHEIQALFGPTNELITTVDQPKDIRRLFDFALPNDAA